MPWSHLRIEFNILFNILVLIFSLREAQNPQLEALLLKTEPKTNTGVRIFQKDDKLSAS